MTRISSVSRLLIEKDLQVNVSARRVLVEHRHDNVQSAQALSCIDDGHVSFRIKPDRRAIDADMPDGGDRRRYC